MSKQFTGMAKLMRQIDSFGADAQRMTKAIVQSTATEVVTKAKRLAPKNLGKLAQSIGKEEESQGFVARIFASAYHAPFVEFGIGAKVRVPPELASMALKYKGKGRGSFDQFLQAIMDWVRQKGITGTYSVKTRKRSGSRSSQDDQDKRVAWLICMSILRKGIAPQPFLYPAYVEGRRKLITTLKKQAAELVRKYNR